VGQASCGGFNLLFNIEKLAIVLGVLCGIFVVTVLQAKDKKYAAIVSSHPISPNRTTYHIILSAMPDQRPNESCFLSSSSFLLHSSVHVNL